VLFRGLGTEWSRDSTLLDALPSNQQACEHWIALREELLAAGYVQTTLTNFERRSVHETARRFSYELYSFQPNRYDMMGFGPSGISFASNDAFTHGWKSTNPESTLEYLRRVAKTATPHSRFFIYDHHDLRVFYLIRRLAMLAIDVDEYEQQSGLPGLDEFAEQLAALSTAGLIEERGKMLFPTPKGMFYADAIASLLVQTNRAVFPGKRKVRRFSHTHESDHVSNMAGYM
jgi:oxygen-independent coproporphyrinogen-3 oxidase